MTLPDEDAGGRVAGQGRARHRRGRRCPTSARPTCWSRSATAACAAATCTWCSTDGDGAARSAATSGAASWSRPGPTSRRWSVGDAVIGGPTPRCGKCEMCRTGHPTLCARARHARHRWRAGRARSRDYTRVDERELLRVPDGLTLREAALAEPLAVALHGITNSGVQPGERALVLGARADRRADDRRAAGDGRRRREGERAVAGAPGARPPARRDGGRRPRRARRSRARSTRARVVDDAVDVVLECSGHGEAMEAGLAQLKRRGTLVLVGAGMARPQFDPNRILLNELVDHRRVLLRRRRLRALARAAGVGPAARRTSSSIPSTCPLAGALDAMHGLAGGQIAAKVLIAPGAAS